MTGRQQDARTPQEASSRPGEPPRRDYHGGGGRGDQETGGVIAPPPVPPADALRMCEACYEGRHWDCGMQTWCECECPGRDGDYDDFEVEP